ncbi:MAG: hypothetical protein ACYC9O_17910 [Candidatus Latescibacterota bacterium]
MLGLGPIELFMAMFFWIIPAALIVVFVVMFLKLFGQIARDISRISQSMQNIEEKLTWKE